MIKSLPSTYRGVLFRSRLEARWAALFDQFKIQWVYEPDAFAAPGGNYLPDFYFPDLDTYVEVKPGPALAEVDNIEFVAKQTGAKFMILDSPIVACRAYPIFLDWGGDDGKWGWNDTAFCCSEQYLTRRDDEYRWFIDVGVDRENCVSSACPNCRGEGTNTDFTLARNLRFNNGVAT